MTPLTRLAAVFAVAAMTLGAGTVARAADFLPAGVNLTAPLSQFTADVGTNSYQVTTLLEDDPNAFLDLTQQGGVPFNPGTFDPVLVLGSVFSTGDGVAYGSTSLHTFTFNLDSPAKTVTVAAKADTGFGFDNFELLIFSNTGENPNTWNVGAVGDGSTTLLGTSSGPTAQVELILTDLIPAEYAIVLRTTAPLSGGDLENGFSALNYQLSLDLAPVPLPAAMWLLVSGLVGLAGFGALRRTRAA